MSSASDNSFTFFFPTWMPFFFSCLIAVVRTSNTVWNRSGEGGQLCLVFDLKGNAFSFSLFSMILAVGMLYMPLFFEVCSLYSHFAESFYYKYMLDFVKCFF